MSMVGVVLAGGKSTRMRQDKALLKFRGTYLLQHQFSLLEKYLGKGNVLVSGDRPDFPHVRDLSSGLGPLEGLRSVCIHLLRIRKFESLLVVPVDMPFISDANFRRLIDHKTKLDITKFQRQRLPVVVYDINKILNGVEAIRESFNAFSQAFFSFDRLFMQLQVDEIPAEDDGCFTNMNTPEDWNAALS